VQDPITGAPASGPEHQNGVLDNRRSGASGDPVQTLTNATATPLEQSATPESDADPLGRRFLNVRTLLSFLVGFALLAFVLARSNVDLIGIVDNIKRANPVYYLAALVFYYLTFPLRALRWRKLLRNVGFLPGEGVKLPSLAGITEIMVLSWFANCIVPAKLGDAYRAYLLKRSSDVSFSKTFGTILAERIIDTLLLFALLAVSTSLAFGSALPGEIQTILLTGLGLVVIVLLGLLSMRNLGRYILPLVPLRLRPHYSMFEAGTLGAFARGRLPMIMVYSLLAWGIEAGRVYLVCLALGLSGLDWPIILFVALAAALLTTLPFTPAGLGLVESGIIGILLLAGSLGLITDIDKNLATSVAILDRTISYWSLILVGAVVYTFSKRR
jgi:glycosyltransferase 2 family protein